MRRAILLAAWTLALAPAALPAADAADERSAPGAAAVLGLVRLAAAASQKYPTSPEDADISITATVRAREMRFDVVPSPTVEFSGTPARITVWEAERENFPRPVEPGVTYQNITVRLTILSRFEDIERIVREALEGLGVTVPDTPGSPESEPRESR